ncbi:YciI family protein [Agromyces salentinus]|uniref:YciI family protein n=1 Tax=Agromyces salentinus TaxID=269421 RepID=A0ABN2MFP9_9MICO|nr:YciI family protein [Agromyces salentinus]
MQYFMFVATDTQPDRSGDEGIPIEQWVAENDERGTRIAGDRLRSIEDATLVRVRDGETIVTDGPFTESKEWIAGYDILDCRDLDEAIEIASRHPMARGGRIELRPFWTGDGE